MFGLTLTRLRSWLRTQAMTNLAELRMHLRDEHLRKGTTKARFSRNITSHTSADQLPPNALPHTSTAPTAAETNPSTSHDVANDPETSTGSNSFRNIVNQLVESVADDNRDDGVSFCEKKVKISVLFDFENSHWKAITQAHALRSLREELELHELIDLDADGEADPDESVDGMTEGLL